MHFRYIFIYLCLLHFGLGLNLGISNTPKTCFVIRTYWGHGKSNGVGSLPKLLKSLQNQRIQNWEAHIIIHDNRPFPDIYDILDSINDKRINLYAYWLSYLYTPYDENGNWKQGYHSSLYTLTDAAIYLGCSPDTQWLVITNGDNIFSDTFLEAIVNLHKANEKGWGNERVEKGEIEVSGEVFFRDNDFPSSSSLSFSSSLPFDVIAMDYYSRYQKVTADPCDRFAFEGSLNPYDYYPNFSNFSLLSSSPFSSSLSSSPLPTDQFSFVQPNSSLETNRCKQNMFNLCVTDITANVLSYPRFTREGYAFGTIYDPSNLGLNDGIMATRLQLDKWKIVRLRDACLVNHAPSPQQCASLGNVWDDTVIDDIRQSAGQCVTPAKAAEMLGIPLPSFLMAMQSDEAVENVMQMVKEKSKDKIKNNSNGGMGKAAIDTSPDDAQVPFEIRRVHLPPFRYNWRQKQAMTMDLGDFGFGNKAIVEGDVMYHKNMWRQLWPEKGEEDPGKERRGDEQRKQGNEGKVKRTIRHPILMCLRKTGFRPETIFTKNYCDENQIKKLPYITYGEENKGVVLS